MRSTLCIAAGAVLHDTQTNGISLFNIIEEVSAGGFPMFLPQIGVLAIWERDAGDPENVDVTFFLRNNAHQLFTTALTLAFAAGTRNRSMLTIGQVVVQEPGRLTMEFRRGDDVVASYAVRVVPPAPAAVGAAPVAVPVA